MSLKHFVWAVGMVATASLLMGAAVDTSGNAVTGATDIGDIDTDATTLADLRNVLKGYHYGTCPTAAGTGSSTSNPKVVTTTTGDFTLEIGAVVVVRFTNGNTLASPYLKVDSTDAKRIYRYGTTSAFGTTSTTMAWKVGEVVPFVYDGTGFLRLSHAPATSSYDGIMLSSDKLKLDNAPTSLGITYGICNTAADTAAKTITSSNYSRTIGGLVSVSFTYDVPANATLNVGSKGAATMKYKGANVTAGLINAGDKVLFVWDGTYYDILAIDRAAVEIDANTVRDIVWDIYTSSQRYIYDSGTETTYKFSATNDFLYLQAVTNVPPTAAVIQALEQ